MPKIAALAYMQILDIFCVSCEGVKIVIIKLIAKINNITPLMIFLKPNI